MATKRRAKSTRRTTSKPASKAKSAGSKKAAGSKKKASRTKSSVVPKKKAKRAKKPATAAKKSGAAKRTSRRVKAKATGAKKRATKSPPTGKRWERQLNAQVNALRQRGETEAARALLAQHAEGGDVIAQRLLGDQYFRDEPHDHALALFWYRRAAAAGDDDAAQNVAYLLRSSEAANPDEADRFLDEMSAAGRPWAVQQKSAIAAAREKERLRAARVSLSDEEKLRELVARFDLAAHADAIRLAARPSVLLLGRAVEGDPPMGTSRVGGDPDLEGGFAWPTRSGRPLAFLAQIDLAMVQSLVPEPALSASGLLSFFYDAEEQPWGAPEERDAWHVVFTAFETPLVRHATPEGATRFSPFALDATRELTLPFVRTVAFRDLGLDDAGAERYGAMRDAYLDEYCRQPARRGDVHRVLGHPDAVQGDMTRRIEYAANDANLEVLDPKLEASARSWRLLFQLGSDFNQSMCWGDNGRLFFWMREEDLAARRWESAMLQLQSH